MKRIRSTSVSAYRDLQPSLSHREQIVLAALREWQGGDPTAYELVEYLRARHLVFDVNGVRPRISALCDKQQVIAGPKRKCAVTGRSAFTWRVPASAPVPQRLEF